MYQEFYGFRELPFEITPHPKFLFLSPLHREALGNLQYGLSSSKAITVLIGEAGTGKTTLLHAALASDRCRHVNCVHINSPTLTRAEFIETLALRFGLSQHATESKAALLDELEPLLREGRTLGKVFALVVDEAQSLSNELLEEVRLLANCETESDKLLPIVLAGQPELRDRLNERGLRQLKQRVTLRCELQPFKLEETAMYIATRLRAAGSDASKIFTREAVTLIHERSLGIPRTINVICDNALVTGFGLERRPIDREMVADVVRDFDLGAEAVSSPRPIVDSGDGPVRGAPKADDESQADASRSRPLFSAFRGH